MGRRTSRRGHKCALGRATRYVRRPLHNTRVREQKVCLGWADARVHLVLRCKRVARVCAVRSRANLDRIAARERLVDAHLVDHGGGLVEEQAEVFVGDVAIVRPTLLADRVH